MIHIRAFITVSEVQPSPEKGIKQSVTVWLLRLTMYSITGTGHQAVLRGCGEGGVEV